MSDHAYVINPFTRDYTPKIIYLSGRYDNKASLERSQAKTWKITSAKIEIIASILSIRFQGAKSLRSNAS